MATDVFNLRAVLGLDSAEFDKGLKNASGNAQSFGQKIASGLGNAVKIGASLAGAGIAAAATGIATLTKQSVQSFADYEQLVGGAELLFGEAYGTIAKYAKTAYKDVQMSQSEYLEQVNGFAVGLKNSLDGDAQAAAELANRILVAEADIVAATGKDAESIQNAFNGIMRNQFTMLDNLGLGINATKEGMQEVIDSVNAWNKAQGRATNYQMGNLADMQSALVDYVEMQGLAGYASMEASKTISGSLASARAAWQNFVTGLADKDADMGALTSNLIESGRAVLNNILPVAKQAVKSIAGAVKEIAPVLRQELPGLVNEILPDLLSAGTDLFLGLVENLPGIVQVLVDALPDVISKVWEAIVRLVGEFSPELSELLGTVGEKFAGIGDWFNENAGPIKEVLSSIGGAIEAAFGWINDHGEEVQAILAAVLGGFLAYQAVTTIINAVAAAQTILNAVMAANPIMLIITAIGALVAAFVTLWNTSEEFRNFWINLWENIKTAFTNFWDGIKSFFTETIPNAIQNLINFFKELPYNIGFALGEAIVKIAQWALETGQKAVEAGKNFLQNVVNFFKQLPTNLANFLSQTIQKIIQWAIDFPAKARQGAKEMFDAVINGIKSLPDRVMTIGRNIVEGLWNGIKNAANWIRDKVADFARGILDGMKSALGIHSPSVEAAWIGKMFDQGFAKGLNDNMRYVEGAMENLSNLATARLDTNISASLTSGFGQQPRGAVTNMGGITININGANYSNENELARAIGRELQMMSDRRAAIFA